MPRYKMVIAYDGTRFAGWQKQEPPLRAGLISSVPKELILGPYTNFEGVERLKLRTVQEIMERALEQTMREPVRLVGASRTDAGVHARHQVAAFTVSDGSAGRGWPESRGSDPLVRALNSRLPDDVLAASIEPVPDDFDPVSWCTSKGYSYTLHVSRVRPLWEAPYVHHIWTLPDEALLHEAAAAFVGEHDFAGFAAAGHNRQTTVRTVHGCSVRIVTPAESESLRREPFDARRAVIEISANGFLWNMVRIIAGTILDVGWGRRSMNDLRAALTTGDRNRAGPTLPPTGLCLEWMRHARPAPTAVSPPAEGEGVP